jgi:hypothetical protein
MQQRLLPKPHQETTARTNGQIAFSIRAGPSVDLSRLDHNAEVNIAICVTMTSSKAATNPDGLNAVIRSARASHIADQMGMGAMLEQSKVNVSHVLSPSFCR